MRWKLRRSRMASSPLDHKAAATRLATLRSHQPLLPRPSISAERNGPSSRMRRRSSRATFGCSRDEVAPPGMAAELAPAELEGRVELERDPARLVAPVLEQRPPGRSSSSPTAGSRPARRESSTIVWLRAPATETVSSCR